MNREARYRKNRRAKGSTQIAVWLSPEDQERLAEVMSWLAMTKSEAVREAVNFLRYTEFERRKASIWSRP
jgi:hypothetical protein